MTAASLWAGAAEPEGVQLLKRPHAGLRVALAQLPIEDGSLEQNMRLAEAAVQQAAKQKVDFLNLPEAADWGWLYQQARRDALPIPGKYTDFLATLAKRHKMWSLQVVWRRMETRSITQQSLLTVPAGSCSSTGKSTPCRG